VWNASNAMVGNLQPVGLNITAGNGMGMTLVQFEGCNLSPPTCPFYPAFALNAIDPTRMLIESNNIYESVTQGDTLINLLASGANVLGYGRPIVYGGSLNGVPMAGVFYVGAGTQIYSGDCRWADNDIEQSRRRRRRNNRNEPQRLSSGLCLRYQQ
jgi:hypothetical protein